MAILAECPQCHRKQATKNKLCYCGGDLDRLKRSKKVKYWIHYRLPGGKQKWEPVRGEGLNPFSIESANEMHSKRVVQKKENRIFDIKPDAKMTFQQLTEWYIGKSDEKGQIQGGLEKVKNQAAYKEGILQGYFKELNEELGNMVMNQIKPVNLENYQVKLKNRGQADATVDNKVGAAKTMINKAFDNDLVGGDTLKSFKKVKDLLKKGSNKRDRVLSPDEYDRLFINAPKHLQGILATAYYAGMREGEILNLTRDKLDLKNRLVKLDPEDTKTKMPRVIPICDELHEILSAIPRAIHDPHVFLYKGNPIHDIRTGLKKACEEAEIIYGRFVKDGFVFHDLRHTFDTGLRRAGVDEIDRMALMGHESREMDRRYNTVDIEDRRQAINKFQQSLRNCLLKR